MLAVIFEPMLALSSILALQRTVLGLGSIVIGNVILTVRSVEAICALAFLINVSSSRIWRRVDKIGLEMRSIQ